MANKPIFSTGPLDPEAMRALVRIWSLHSDGHSWAEIGKDMKVPDLQMGFRGLIEPALKAQEPQAITIWDAYLAHYANCDDCEGPDLSDGLNDAWDDEWDSEWDA